MTDYLYLFRGGDAGMAKLSPEQIQAHMQAWGAWMGELGQKGKLKGGEPLAKEGKQLVAADRVLDGPYTEGEMVGGYLIVKAGNLDEATELAKGCPIFETGGTIEVRPLNKMMNELIQG